MNITHIIQINILKRLLILGNTRFTDLKYSKEIPNDHFSFHLKRLLKLNLVCKIDNLYKLTIKGTEIAGRIDTSKNWIIKQPKLGVALVIIKKFKAKNFILLEKRLINPNKNKIGSHTEKIRFNESIFDTAKRCLKTHTGLSGKFKYCGTIRVIRRIDSIPSLDVLLIIFKVTNLKGILLSKTKESENFWIEYEKAYNLKNTFEFHKKSLDLYKRNRLFFDERIISK